MYPPNYWKKQEGKWFGSKYLLKEFLGSGAYGAVFRADEILAERVMQSVAVKIVIADINNLDTQLAELQLSVKFRHPHLINGITCEQGDIFGDLCLGLVMELAEESLESYVTKQAQSLSTETVHTITEHLAKGLAALHKDSITHRDLKPANILLVKDLWKLGDFGIARSLQDKTSTYTRPSQQIGTVAYMPPEAYSGKISPAWDLWALGVMIHQLVSGQHPFPTQSAPELMRMVLMEEPQIDPKVTSPLREIVAGCLIKDSQQRWSAEQILEALRPSPQPEASPAGQRLSSLIKLDDLNPCPVQASGVYSSQKDKSSLTTIHAYGINYFDFESVTINRQGQIIKRTPGRAKFYRENIGKGVYLDIVYIAGGTFLMGASESEYISSDNERPQHSVTVPNFWMGKFLITQEQWQCIMAGNPSRFRGVKKPVEKVSWQKCKEFCKILSKKTGKNYRLPSEAEWEYACRAGTNTAFYCGETITTELANYDGSHVYADELMHVSRGQTVEIEQFPPNAFGLYDMCGNLWQWCEDSWHSSYKNAPAHGEPWQKPFLVPDQSTQRVRRGGSWRSKPAYCRSASRSSLDSNSADITVGFRVVVDDW